MTRFGGKLGIQQRVLAEYRAPFFDSLAEDCEGRLSVCAGQPMAGEAISVTDSLRVAEYTRLQNVHLLRGAALLCHQRGVLTWLREQNPDVLIAEVNPRTISTPTALRWMKARRRPVIGWGLGAPPPASWIASLGRAGEGTVRSLLGRLVHHFDALLTYSRQGAEQYAGLGYPSERIFIAPNAATPPPARPMPVRPDHFAGKPTILFVGRLQKRKRVDLLLEACTALPEGLQPHLVIIGDGPEHDPLSALAGKIYPQAEFHGALHGEELDPFYRAADLFVLPGTGGLAVQQAMSYGLPVIMGAGDGTNDDLVRPENGWQLGAAEVLGGTLQTALADVPRLRSMGAASYRIVAQEINLDTMKAGFMQAISAVAPEWIRL